jgi:hypothetical protein
MSAAHFSGFAEPTYDASTHMKLVTYDIGAGPRAGILVDDQVVDTSALLGSAVTLRNVRALLESSDSAVERLRDANRARQRRRACLWP